MDCKRLAVMTLCNLTANAETRGAAIRGGGLQTAVRLTSDGDVECRRYAATCVCNMANDHQMQVSRLSEWCNVGATFRRDSRREQAEEKSSKYKKLRKQCTFACCLRLCARTYSVCQALGATAERKASVKVLDTLTGQSRCFNPSRSSLEKHIGQPKTCGHALRICVLPPPPSPFISNALVIFFIAMTMQLQVVVHGGLPPIMSMATSDNSDDHRHAAMALGNIAANEGNHPQLVAKGAIQTLVALSRSPELDVREYAGFALANLASNADYLDAIGAKGGIDPLVKLAGSANVHTQVGVCENARYAVSCCTRRIYLAVHARERWRCAVAYALKRTCASVLLC